MAYVDKIWHLTYVNVFHNSIVHLIAKCMSEVHASMARFLQSRKQHKQHDTNTTPQTTKAGSNIHSHIHYTRRLAKAK